jgi:hypothetical protein
MVGQVLQQRGLAYTWLAVNDQGTTLAGANC